MPKDTDQIPYRTLGATNWKKSQTDGKITISDELNSTITAFLEILISYLIFMKMIFIGYILIYSENLR
jgi:hypothetical protein